MLQVARWFAVLVVATTIACEPTCTVGDQMTKRAGWAASGQLLRYKRLCGHLPGQQPTSAPSSQAAECKPAGQRRITVPPQMDFWERPYYREWRGDHVFVRSWGGDGKKGGRGDDADIFCSVWPVEDGTLAGACGCSESSMRKEMKRRMGELLQRAPSPGPPR